MRTFITIVFTFFSLSIYSQNLIMEGDFETSVPSNYCYNLNVNDEFSERYEHWETRFSTKAKYRKTAIQLYRYRDAGWGDEGHGCHCGNYHSPDTRPDDNGGLAAGFGEYELIQQKLLDDNRFEVGKHYRVSFEMNVVGAYNFGEYVPDNSRLKFIIATRKVKYKKPGYEFGKGPLGGGICEIGLNPNSGTAPDGYKEYKGFNDIRVLKRYNLRDYPIDTWVSETFIFTMEDEGIDRHNWFVVDIENGGGIAIDDIRVEEVDYCNYSDECSPTDGDIMPSSPYKNNPNYANMIVGNLDNVYSATDIRILTTVGQVIRNLPDQICVNGISEVSWDLTSNGSAPVAQGTYFWEMLLNNDCGTYTYRQPVVVMEPYHNLPVLDEAAPCNNSVIVPIQCCDAEPNILIEGEVIEGQNKIEYHAIETIRVRETLVKNNTENLSIIAGQAVYLEHSVRVEKGAEVSIRIEPCETIAKQTKSQEDYEVNGSEDMYTKSITGFENSTVDIPAGEYISEHEITTKEMDAKSINIFPNPVIDNLNISLPSVIVDDIFKIEISSILGRTEFVMVVDSQNTNVTIDMSNFPTGFYLVKIAGYRQSKTFKVCKK